ncbi:MAG TPA: GGDEF domain-containing protein [Granulicella sp.]|nr:GGDEF domain-containing protein [Granulicella sp.]
MSKTAAARSISTSSRPAPRQLESLAQLQRISLVFASLLALTILAAWICPPLGALLPSGWNVMRADTAVLLLCGAVSLALSQPRRSARALLLSRLLGTLVFISATIIGLEYAFRFTLPIDRLLDLAYGPIPAHAGRMSPQGAASLALIGFLSVFIRVRKRLLAHIADVAVLVLCMLSLTILSGYLYGAMGLFGLSMDHRTAPHSLLAIALLTFVCYTRRAEYGMHSVVLGAGISGRIARIAMPLAILLPFLFIAARALATRLHLLTPEYANALTSSSLSLGAIISTLFLTWHIDSLESEVRDLSLRDELTGLYNRRGFYILAEQALRLARRDGEVFSVLYLDLDRLKPVNDTLGHEVGSEMLQRIARLLLDNFREVDVVGRIGGDEFVVASRGTAADVVVAIERLEQATSDLNAHSGLPYTVSFTLGSVTAEDNNESLDTMLNRADKIMYERKHRKSRAYST